METTVLSELIKLGGGYVLAAFAIVVLVGVYNHWLTDTKADADRRVALERERAVEKQAQVEQYRADCDRLAAILQQNTQVIAEIKALLQLMQRDK